jgi:acetyl-CoA synthetase
MVTPLTTYHFYRDKWDDYQSLNKQFEWEIPSTFNIADYVCDRWASDGDRIALLVDEDNGEQSVYTFSDVKRITNQLANYLTQEGVSQGDKIGVTGVQRAETAFTHIAAWKVGAISVPLSTKFGPDSFRYRFDDCKMKYCLADEICLEDIRSAREASNVTPDLITPGASTNIGSEITFKDAIRSQPHEYNCANTDPDDDALVIYTSGTTGQPKGVRHGHRVLLGHLPFYVTNYLNMELCETERIWTPIEWSWVASVVSMLLCSWFYGVTVVANPTDQFTPGEALQILNKYDVSVFFTAPTVLRMLSQYDAQRTYDLDTVRVIPTGGESLNEAVTDWCREQFGDVAIHEGYGQTEANNLIGDCTALAPSKGQPIGLPGVGHELAILDPDTHEQVSEGEIGEIAVRYGDDPVCFKSYLNKPEETEKKVQDEWLLTGDLGIQDADGYVAFKGRKDAVIISSGYRIAPQEIEESLTNHDAVAEAGVVGVNDETKGEIPQAFVVLADEYEPSDSLQSDLQEFVKSNLAKYEYPRRLTFVKHLPRSASGKLRRAELTEWIE